MEIRTLTKAELVCLAVEQGQIPRYLYKYCTTSSALRILGNHSIWFATSDTFNDPFDCEMQIYQQYTEDEWRYYLTSQGVDTGIINKILIDIMAKPAEGVKIIKKSIDEVKKNIGIFCLANRSDNLSLWAHYADEHRGVCLEFDLLADPETFCIPKKVLYDNTFPVVNYLKDQSTVVEALSQKSRDWKMEGEYRIIKYNKTGLKEFRPEALTKVILGLHCSDTDTEKIKLSINPEIYTKAQLYRTVKKDDKYEVELREITQSHHGMVLG